ncbi:SRPBCC domain-containing protein [Telmatobacter sp. DSM 110680]|uniref:SRPBCC domain-containing protein n=1 Tax=Telmatobacter sp. DSM 110680 TaxID=3036704 RepID=A0AAU7DK47_9BACT
MSTNILAGHPVSTICELKRHPLTDRPLSITAMTNVNADRSRIYHALTVAEYIEAWFSVPGAIAGHTRAFAHENSLSIRYCTQHQQFAILCSYHVCRRSKLMFSWQHSALDEATPSFVKIRLIGNFGRTTVHVTHAGLTLSNQKWHENLWTLSLVHLSKLF